MNIFQQIGKKVTKTMQKMTKKEMKEAYKKLSDWQDKFEDAKGNIDLQKFDEWELIYLGTSKVDKNINSHKEPTKEANNVRNVAYEMIETQTETSIPQPTVKSKRSGWTYHTKMVEDKLRNDIKELEIEKLVNQQERDCPVHGYSLLMVNWNPDFKHHLYRGELDLRLLHPKQIVPQPGVYDIQKMDYFFVLSSVTKQYIKKRYGLDLEDDTEEYPEINTLSDTETYYTYTETSHKVTEIVAWYKDEDGDIGKFVWVNDQVMEDLPKYYKRRLKRCKECNTVMTGYKECPECQSTKVVESFEEYEEITEDMELLPIEIQKTVYKDGKQQVVKETIDRKLKKGDKIPYFQPTQYPVLIRENTPKNFCFGGQSDIAVIRDQVDAIKKVVSRIEEKILNSSALIKVLEDHNVSITTALYSIIKGTQQQLAALGVENLSADIEQDIAFAQQQYEYIQSTLGITDSFQGKYDPSAKSGVAKRLQIQQAAGRLASKLFNKYYFFKQLYRVMFEHYIAFYDELRPYLTKTSKGEDDYGEFNKYEFLMQDKAGEWYYNTDFLFSADAGEGIPNDKMWIYEQALEMFGAQAIDLVQFWTILESLHFPNASMILNQIKEQQEMEENQGNQEPTQQITPEQIISQLSPEEQQQFAMLPPEQQEQFIQQAMGGM